MKRWTRSTGFWVIVFLISLSGCASPEDRLVREQIDLLDQLARAYENKADAEVFTVLTQRAEANVKKMKKLNLSVDRRRELLEKYQDELMEAVQRVVSAQMSGFMESPEFMRDRMQPSESGFRRWSGLGF